MPLAPGQRDRPAEGDPQHAEPALRAGQRHAVDHLAARRRRRPRTGGGPGRRPWASPDHGGRAPRDRGRLDDEVDPVGLHQPRRAGHDGLADLLGVEQVELAAGLLELLPHVALLHRVQVAAVEHVQRAEQRRHQDQQRPVDLHHRRRSSRPRPVLPNATIRRSSSPSRQTCEEAARPATRAAPGATAAPLHSVNSSGPTTSATTPPAVSAPSARRPSRCAADAGQAPRRPAARRR